MNKIKVLIADDEAPARNRMIRMLDTIENVELVNVSTNGVDALNNLLQLKPDLAILDIEMPGMNGLEVVKNLPSALQTRIIFATAYNEHAITAFEVNAVDYLLKPFNAERLKQAVDKVQVSQQATIQPVQETIEKMQEQDASGSLVLNKIPVPVADRIKLIEVKDIICIEVDDRVAMIYTLEKSWPLNSTLDSLEKKLPPDKFIRINRSCIINIHAIKEIILWFSNRYKIVLEGGKEIVSSRERSRQLKQLLKL